jgi:hypothetical protein
MHEYQQNYVIDANEHGSERWINEHTEDERRTAAIVDRAHLLSIVLELDAQLHVLAQHIPAARLGRALYVAREAANKALIHQMDAKYPAVADGQE